jgi:hypothetical protein
MVDPILPDGSVVVEQLHSALPRGPDVLAKVRRSTVPATPPAAAGSLSSLLLAVPTR